MMSSRTTIRETGKANARSKTFIKGGKTPARVEVNHNFEIGENLLALGVLYAGGLAIKGVVTGATFVGNAVYKKFSDKKVEAKAFVRERKAETSSDSEED